MTFHRSFDFTASFGVVVNALGKSPKTQLERWDSPEGGRLLLARREVWDEAERRAATAATTTLIEECQPGAGAPPEDLFDLATMKHSQMRYVSLIRPDLWDAARWKAVAYGVSPDTPPLMALIFANPDPAAAILTELIREIGRDDPRNQLRISIIRGISRAHPTRYRVVIGSNVEYDGRQKLVAVVSRMHEMRPESDEYLNAFLSAYAVVGRFQFGVGAFDPDDPTAFPQPATRNVILKRQLTVRHAWQIGMNDPDLVALDEGDDVFLPAEHSEDAPVLEALKQRERRPRSKPPIRG